MSSNKICQVLALSVFAFTAALFIPNHAEATPTREWTFLLYLNGNNSLDSFGPMNLNSMEQVGSSDQVNLVVQWSSLASKKTKRMLIKKDNDTTNVTSPTVQDVSGVDMGDWNSLVDFVRWGVAAYPAKHYFITVWDHGSGWHTIQNKQARSSFHTFDISWDDNTGHSFTTAQLGLAMAESAKIIGHKVDIYGSDACLMAMAEVADEMSASVNTFVGSEEVEPAEGWPYESFLTRWIANPTATPNQVGTYLTEEYVKAYQGGVYGTKEVQFSAFDLNNLSALKVAVETFGKGLMTLDAASRKAVIAALGKTQKFYTSDYADLGDFLLNVEAAKLGTLGADLLSTVRSALNQVLVANSTSGAYKKATGLSIWLPSTKSKYNMYAAAYKTMAFDAATHWGDTLKFVTQDK